MRSLLAVLVLLAGCAASDELRDLRPTVDLSPVGCGYKWFQSGYSPTIQIPCEQDRSTLRQEYKDTARADAWDVAQKRCPSSCAPTELQDTVQTEDRDPNGVCRGGYAYFSTRVFFQCGRE